MKILKSFCYFVFLFLLFNVSCSQHSGSEGGEEKKQETDSSFIEQKAIEIVKSLPDVANYLNENKDAIVEVDQINHDTILVHVYKISIHEDGGGTTGTYNWYFVNAKTWKVEPMF